MALRLSRRIWSLLSDDAAASALYCPATLYALDEVAVVGEDEPEERETAERDEDDPVRQDRAGILFHHQRDLAPEEQHEPDLGPHERRVLVSDAGPAVGLHHRPVEERVRRLIEVQEDRDEPAHE